VLLAVMTDDSIDTWIFRNGYENSTNLQIYVASVYFILSTITTVGFGDISGKTVGER
jgi:hypothetical protein